MVDFKGNVDVAVLDIGEGGAAAINGDLTFVGSEVLNMASDAMLGVNGEIICSAVMSANVDATATILLGSNECPALSGLGGLL